jgi:Reverse transcriptase (RNA-dependent DNA polymerase)
LLNHEKEDKKITIGAEAPAEDQQQLVMFLHKNNDVFAWSPRDLQGVSRNIIQHKLNVDPKAKPRKQKLRKASGEREEAAKAEVEKLLDAGVIREVMHSEWLANPVLVRKSNGKWRMCIDFTDLNKACPKDDFPLPRIDQLIDSAAGCEMLSFLDAYAGYHQIWMAKEDEDKTSFRTSFRT